MTEGFRGMIAWLILLPLWGLLGIIFWLPSLGHTFKSGGFWDEIKLGILRWADLGWRGLRQYSEWD